MPPDEDFFGGDEDGLKLRLQPETNRKQTARRSTNLPTSLLCKGSVSGYERMAAARTLKDDNVSLTNELTHFDGLCINMQKLCFAHIVFSFFMFVQMNSESSGMSGCCGATFVVWLSFSTTWTSTASAHTARALEEHRSVSVTRCFCRCLKHRFTFIQGSTMVEATKEGTCLALREGQSL